MYCSLVVLLFFGFHPFFEMEATRKRKIIGCAIVGLAVFSMICNQPMEAEMEQTGCDMPLFSPTLDVDIDAMAIHFA